ncbi:isopentenyltransferase [Parasponia andersonii]|uniref:adenylate dimethylallyltransferase (ADP/ATP-dependent) n=1 Tax=Parasponia andersonii TaxID=3476 RepID=A0A2P5DZC8_PARAD|nr:isopentenyltransferase [Parasponia andersonii]
MKLDPFITTIHYSSHSYSLPHCYHYSSSSSSSFFRSLISATKPTGASAPRARSARMDYSTTTTPSAAATAGVSLRRHRHRNNKDKLLVIMGATGTGKSRLSIDLAAHFPLEVINSDKMQFYEGLDITTNKIPVHDRLGVAHHLLGDVYPAGGELTPAEFRSLAGKAIADITGRRKLPVLVGGSNSFIHALVVDRFDSSGSNVFEEGSNSVISTELRYNCCLIWVDVSIKVLNDYLSKRVDDMLDSGMFDELADFYVSEDEFNDDDSAARTGLRKAIGVPEFDLYFKKFRPGSEEEDDPEWDRMRRGAFEEAVRAMKENTCQLAKNQIGKILRLKGSGWDLRRLDATEAFRAVLTSESGQRCTEIWERQVLEPSVKIVKRFLDE